MLAFCSGTCSIWLDGRILPIALNQALTGSFTLSLSPIFPTFVYLSRIHSPISSYIAFVGFFSIQIECTRQSHHTYPAAIHVDYSVESPSACIHQLSFAHSILCTCFSHSACVNSCCTYPLGHLDAQLSEQPFWRDQGLCVSTGSNRPVRQSSLIWEGFC